MSAQLQAMLLALTKSRRHAFDAACEAATIAACCDGYRGRLYIMMGTCGGNCGDFDITVTRSADMELLLRADRARFGLPPAQVRIIEVTEEGAREMMKLINSAEGTPGAVPS